MKTIQMRYKKSTKNTNVYEEIDDTGEPMFQATIPTLYIARHALPGQPIHIEVSIGLEGERHVE